MYKNLGAYELHITDVELMDNQFKSCKLGFFFFLKRFIAAM